MSYYKPHLTCCRYGSDSHEDASESSSQDRSSESDPESNFREYAICHWAHHFSKVTEDPSKSEIDAVLKQFVSAAEGIYFNQWLGDVQELVESKRAQASHLKQLNAIQNDLGSPIFVACVYGIPLILEQLRSEAPGSGKNIDYNAKNSHGTSALYISARYGHTNTLQFLLDQGASIDVSGGFFGNPLQAALQDNPDVIELLLKEGASPDCPGLQYTALMSVLREAARVRRSSP